MFFRSTIFKWKLYSLRGKRFRLVWEEKKTVEADFRFYPREKPSFPPPPPPLPALLLAPFFARSLTIVPHSLLLNRTETLATQARSFMKGVPFQSKIVCTWLNS